MAEIGLLWRYYLGIEKLMAQIHFLMAKTIRPVEDLVVQIILLRLSTPTLGRSQIALALFQGSASQPRR
jgi:hypothetical protein